MKTIKLLLIMLFSFAIAACGGGGGGNGGGDTTAPTVSSVNPANNAAGVALNSTIAATFSEAMTAATLNATTFTLDNGATCAVTYTGTTATCTPTANLTANTTYNARISTGAKNLAGNALAAPYTWSFTTATPTTISGTAAAGAPIIGTVKVLDSSSPQKTLVAPIEANGHYAIDVTGLTPPYAFLATGTVGGKSVTLYSAATAADVGGTINITPFTDLIIRNIAASAVDAYLAKPANLANFTPAQLDAQRATLTAQLAPALAAMGVSSSIDLLRTTFNADSTGLDRFMDVVKVSTVGNTATITNILDAANTLTINTNTGATTGTLGTANLATSGTPLDGMLATAQTFTSLFATSLPSATNPTLLSLVSSSFLDNGDSGAIFITNITTFQGLIGAQLSNLVIDSIDATGTIAQVSYTLKNAAGTLIEPSSTSKMQMKKNATTGVWQFDGNRRIARVTVNAFRMKEACNPSTLTACNPATPQFHTGLRIDIENNSLQPIGSVVVTGSGLPTGGLTLSEQPTETFFRITNVNNLCAGSTQCNLMYWYMSDTEIAQLTPNSSYTVKLYSNAATPVLLNTYTEVVPIAPTLNSELTASIYPSLTGMVNLEGIGAATLTPHFIIPQGLVENALFVYVWQQTTGANLSLGGSVVATGGSAGTPGTQTSTREGTVTLAVTAPPNGGTWDGTTYSHYSIYALDQYGGEVTTHYRSGDGGAVQPPATQSIVGSWSNMKIGGVSQTYGGGTNIVLTFFANGDYMMAQSTTPPFNVSSAMPGIEHGAYTWNPSTGAFSTPCPTIDTNGQAGFSHSTPSLGCTGTNTTITVSGNTMSLLDNSTNPPTPLTFERVVDATNAIVGTWYDGNTNRVFTFFANGDYMHAKAVTTNAGAFPGLEHGTYTWNPTTGAFAGACPPDVDTNGTDGLSHPNGVAACTGSTSTTGIATVSGNTMSYTVNGNSTLNLVRVMP